MVRGVRCEVLGVWCVIYGMRRIVCIVWCEVGSVRCNV